MLFETEISWCFVTNSYILEKVLRTLSKIWDFIFIIRLFVSRGNGCNFRVVGKNSFKNTANGWGSTSADILASLGEILSVPVDVLLSIF